MGRSRVQHDRREDLLEEISQLATTAIFGSISETYRTCGNAGCRCHGPGPKHGPHMYVSYRGTEGKTTGFYVPKSAHEAVRHGTQAWQVLQERLRELADLNRQIVLKKKSEDADA